MEGNERNPEPLRGRVVVYRDGLPTALGLVERADSAGAFLRVGDYPLARDTRVAIESRDGGCWLWAVVVGASESGIEVRFTGETAGSHARAAAS